MKTTIHNRKNYNPNFLWFNHGKKSINPDEVVYLKSCDNYTRFYLSDGKSFLASSTMKSYEKELLKRGYFTRLHRGTLVNLKYLTGIERTKDGPVACLSTGQRIDVSRRKMRILDLP
ncbi:MAG: LytR/AlgR family response regulator transcription factor [Emticicia sp.]|uniref:LytR/AlgR family response regulator transcription factor n=1 Tax=Emticicia sp. TaxID=1930953 RepID=UPI003BA6EE01